jgi:hypothetical protein
MEAPALVKITCAHCGRTCQSRVEQPKQVAKMFRWKHGEAKGVWVCAECQGLVSVNNIFLIGTPGLRIGDFIIGGQPGEVYNDVKKL